MKIIHILLKDIKQILYDKKLLIIMLVMPIVLMTILGFSLNNMFGSSGSEINAMKVAVVKAYHREADEARLRQELSSGVLAMGIDDVGRETLLEVAEQVNPEDIFFDFLDDESIRKYMTYTVENLEEAERQLQDKQVSAVIILPDGYVYNSYVNILTPSRNIVEIDILKRTGNQIKSSIVELLIGNFTQNFNNNALNKSIITDTLMAHKVEGQVLEIAATLTRQVMEEVHKGGMRIKEIGVEEKEPLSSFQYYAAAIMAMFVLYSAGYGGRQVLQEKRNITLQRNQVAGVSMYKILFSTFLMMVIVSAFQAFVMICYTHFALKIYWGDFRLVALTVLMSSFAVAGLGLLVAVITYRIDNFKVANLFESGIIQVMALLGGSFVPIAVLPAFMQNLSYVALNGVALKMYTGIMSGAVLGELSRYILILGSMGLLFITVAISVMGIRREAV